MFDDFLERNQLPIIYLKTAEKWFAPLADTLSKMSSKDKNKGILVGINGCQGSGKSTMADYLCTILRHKHNINAISLSLDDFYLSRAERLNLAENVHELFKTRGVPGTHDTDKAIKILQSLKSMKSAPVTLPGFNKAIDDVDKSMDRILDKPYPIIIFEGWCMGISPQSQDELRVSLNDLEEKHDKNGIWREYINQALGKEYGSLFSLIDYWVMLKAPSFECVYQWRWEQEKKLIRKQSQNPNKENLTLNKESLKKFISHYQRITEHSLETLPPKMHQLYELDEKRQIISQCQPNNYSL